MMLARGRRATMAAALSLLAHAGLIAIVTSRPHLSTMAELAPPSVTFDVRATTLDELASVPQPTPARAPTKGRGTIRSASRRLPRVVTSFAPHSDVPALASLDSGNPGDEIETEEPTPAAAPAATPVEVERTTSPTTAPVVTPDVAQALRVYDTYPMLLAQASLTRAEILVEVCVSDHGRVSDAVIAEGGMAAFDHTLRTAIRSWRYRPLLVNGAPTPFCHFMRIKYALN
jgi:TonB family protein